MLKKQMFLGTNSDDHDVFVTVTIPNGNVLRISGVVGPMHNGDARGSCGQIIGECMKTYAPGWNMIKIAQLYDIWERWHLNDKRVGDDPQEFAVREWKKENKCDYNAVCLYLDELEIRTNNGYQYGTKWLKEKLPQRVYNWFEALPETTKSPPDAWID